MGWCSGGALRWIYFDSAAEEAPPAAPWLITAGLAVYLVGTRVFNAVGRPSWRATAFRAVALGATVCVALLRHVVSAPVVVVVTACWAVVAAVAVSSLRRAVVRRLGDDPLAFLGPPKSV